MPVRFQTLDEFASLLRSLPGPDAHARASAEARNAQLTKPVKALGRLEEMGIWYASWRGSDRARIRAPQVIVFAGNHGVAGRGVSAYPSEVTEQMVANFHSGGAAINQIARIAGATLDVVAIELERPTQDFTIAPAMSEHECTVALETGWSAVGTESDLLVVGEMGIGNSTSAAALAAALFGGYADAWTGRGTGIDDLGLERKKSVVLAGLARHENEVSNPLRALACLGGRELAAMAGAIARARDLRIPVILDGFICTAAAAVLERSHPGALDHCIAGHSSAEPGHRKLLEALGKPALLDLGMRLGEGSGAALAMNILKAATECLAGMATFGEAGVSTA